MANTYASQVIDEQAAKPRNQFWKELPILLGVAILVAHRCCRPGAIDRDGAGLGRHRCHATTVSGGPVESAGIWQQRVGADRIDSSVIRLRAGLQ